MTREQNAIYQRTYRSKHKEKVKEYRRGCYQKNKEVIKETSRRSYHNNREARLKYNETPTHRYNYSISQAKKREIEWTITYFDYCELIKQKCYYYETHIMPKCSVGLDRIDNSKGY